MTLLRSFPLLGLRMVGLVLLTVLVAACAGEGGTPRPSDGVQDPAAFQVDPGWLSPDWVFGPALGMDVDDRDHIWVTFRERGGHLAARDDHDVPQVACCLPAPLVMELDPDGHVVQAWRDRTEVPHWPEMAHGIHVDANRFVWVIDRDQHQILKLTDEGEHVLTIGRPGETGGSEDVARLGRPSNVWVHPETNELFVADGYGNRRVIVFDAATGAYLRHWGAYGAPPDDQGPRGEADAAGPLGQYAVVHGIIGSQDGRIYVADRGGQRIQVFETDGTFLAEAVVAPGMDLAFSPDPDQTWLYLADGNNHQIWVLRRATLEVMGSFGAPGDYDASVARPHSIAVDSRGRLHTAEQADQTDGRRLQRFIPGGTGGTGVTGVTAPVSTGPPAVIARGAGGAP
ncbi:MAG: hypothetical protein EA421_16965 [Gemmatimonadales bacterium]|nr:MAG: hypothetical protein EA421_16965 [Gemmatimonadales bacterium]